MLEVNFINIFFERSKIYFESSKKIKKKEYRRINVQSKQMKINFHSCKVCRNCYIVNNFVKNLL